MTDADRLLLLLLALIKSHNDELIGAGLARFILDIDAAAEPPDHGQ